MVMVKALKKDQPMVYEKEVASMSPVVVCR